MGFLLKRLIRKVFSASGLEIYRKGRVQLARTMGEVLDHFSKLGFRPQTIIDVGVAYGTFDLYDKFPGARCLLVEPLEEYQEDLKEITRSPSYKAEYVLAAAGATSGKISINVHPDLSGSSLFHETEGRHIDGFSREVPLVTIDDLCDEKGLTGPYLIKVDVQGAELEVLRGAKSVLRNTDVIMLEISLFEFFQEGPQFYDVVSYMKEHGFCVYDIFGGHYRPFDGALAQIDIAFVKENGCFRKYHCYATREQRERLTKQEVGSVNPEQ